MTVFLLILKIFALLLFLVVAVLVITTVILTLQIRKLAVDSQSNIKASVRQVSKRFKARLESYKRRKYRRGKIVRKK